MSKQPTSVRLPDLTISQLAKLIATTGMTQSEIFATAIDRMYQQEIQSMTTQTELTYRIPTNEDYYTQDAAEEYLIAGLLDNQAVKIAAYLDEHFPGMAYEIEFVPETQSYNNRSKAHSEQAEQALEAVENYVETHWYNWWPEPTA